VYICKRQETITGSCKRNLDNVPETAFVILQRATYTSVYTLLHKAYLEEIWKFTRTTEKEDTP